MFPNPRLVHAHDATENEITVHAALVRAAEKLTKQSGPSEGHVAALHRCWSQFYADRDMSKVSAVFVPGGAIPTCNVSQFR